MGVYIEGLDRPRGEYMRIHIDFDGEVWVFRESGWESLEIKATNLDLVKCRECKHSKNCTYPAKWNWCPDGERKGE